MPDKPPISTASAAASDDGGGYRLWLRFAPSTHAPKITGVCAAASSPTLSLAQRELLTGLSGITGRDVRAANDVSNFGIVVLATPSTSPGLIAPDDERQLKELGPDGFIIRSSQICGKDAILIASLRDVGVLYGAFHFLRLLQTQRIDAPLNIAQRPKLAAYLSSERRIPFNEQGIFRRYPELDG